MAALDRDFTGDARGGSLTPPYITIDCFPGSYTSARPRLIISGSEAAVGIRDSNARGSSKPASVDGSGNHTEFRCQTLLYPKITGRNSRREGMTRPSGRERPARLRKQATKANVFTFFGTWHREKGSCTHEDTYTTIFALKNARGSGLGAHPGPEKAASRSGADVPTKPREGFRGGCEPVAYIAVEGSLKCREWPLCTPPLMPKEREPAGGSTGGCHAAINAEVFAL